MLLKCLAIHKCSTRRQFRIVNCRPFLRTHCLLNNADLSTKRTHNLTIIPLRKIKMCGNLTTQTLAIFARSIDRRQPLCKQRYFSVSLQTKTVQSKLCSNLSKYSFPSRSVFKNKQVIPASILRNQTNQFCTDFSIFLNKILEEITENVTFTLSTTNIPCPEENTGRSLRIFLICKGKKSLCLIDIVATSSDFTKQIHTSIQSRFVCLCSIQSFSGIQFRFKCCDKSHCIFLKLIGNLSFT